MMPSDDTWFDREICPCGDMHERFDCCGTPVDDCPIANGDFSSYLRHAANCGKPSGKEPEDWTDVIEEAKRWGF